MRKVLQILIPLTSLGFLVGVAFVFVMLARGYTINFKKQTFEKTGVVNVVTDPSGAFIWLDSRPYGKSNKALPAIKIGEYELKLFKDKYFPFKEKIRVAHARATLINVKLVSQAPGKLVLNLDPTDKWFIDRKTHSLFLLTQRVIRKKGSILEYLPLGEDIKKVSVDHKDKAWHLYRVYLYSNVLSGVGLGIDEITRIDSQKPEIIQGLDRILKVGKYVIFMTKKKEAYLIKPNVQPILDEFLTSYLQKGYRLLYGGDTHVVLTTDYTVFSYDLKHGVKTLIVDIPDEKFCVSPREKDIVVVASDWIRFYDYDGVENLKLETKLKHVSDKCFAFYQNNHTALALVFKDKVRLLGDLFVRDSKIYKGIPEKIKITSEGRTIELKVGKSGKFAWFDLEDVSPDHVFWNEDKDRFVFVSKKTAYRLTYNRDQGDVATRVELVKLSSAELRHPTVVFSGQYLASIQGSDFRVVSVLAPENNYKLAEGIADFVSDPGVRGVLFIKNRKVKDEVTAETSSAVEKTSSSQEVDKKKKNSKLRMVTSIHFKPL